MFGALALVLIDKVESATSRCKSTQLLYYFEKQWIKKISLEVSKHFDSVTRMNNKEKGYHPAINKLVRAAHPNLFDIIDFIKSKQFSPYLNYLSTNDFQEYLHGFSYHIRYPYEKIFEVDDSDDDFKESNSYSSASVNSTLPELNFESVTVVKSCS
ncbi:hypothetical protein BpHYR1_036162 [Brachionus plicatilis]|uniref:Uncharacterized protein n=1 Tax=Brachionus plicatilis TaxID=10195 RepID=A0A3M7STA6_BRAPC|nr:hypothetical protein BpHYR1_036162 [Brachionus plicatilis]